MIGRIVRSADFERVLASPTRARSAHFAVHYLASNPSRTAPPARLAAKLSTGQAPIEGMPVDELPPAGLWLGTVVPKRHAKRAVTRSLLKREIRHAVNDVQANLSQGLWVVRLRTPFDRQQFSSASSEALGQAAAQELSVVLAHAARRVGG